MKTLLAAFLAEVGLVTYRSVRSGGVVTPTTAPISAPLPSLYTSAVLVYGTLSLAPSSLVPVASLVGWGFVVATFLNLFSPGAANTAAASSAKLASALGPSPTGATTGSITV
jgi:hypothetical protein